MKNTSTQSNSDVNFAVTPATLSNAGRLHSLKKYSARTFLFAVALLSSFFAQSQATPTVLVPSSGSINVPCGQLTVLQDHAGNSNYSNSVNGYALLNGGWGAVAVISGTYATESGYDYVRIYNGNGTGGTLLLEVSGSGNINYTTTPGQNISVRFSSDGSTVDKGFELTVTWSGSCLAPPCSGVPASNTVVPSTNNAICPNTALSYSLNYNYEGPYPSGVSGLSYVWQYSDISPVGPWTVVPTATTQAYTTPTLNINRYYTVLVTCANGNGTYTPVSSEAIIAGTTINNVPYYEGFEGITYNGELPNCSWLNGTPANISTYTQTTTQNRSANTGVKYAGINAAATATNYLYTNGVQLYAGVTYSAAMFYKTEYQSLLNFTDLSILIGMTQTPTGLVSVVSSNGPAFSNNYKLLSGTFVVPSSGVYYMAMRATSNNGSYYMSIDDVSITAPCSLNSPTLAVSGGTTTCSGSPVNITVAGANTYSWSVNNLRTAAISVTPVVTANTVINYSVTGTNTLSGCSTTLVRPITVNVGPAVSVFPLDATLCEGASTVLYASSTNQATNFVWNTSGAPGYSTQVSPAATTVYSVNATTNANNCITTSTIEVTVVDSPTITPSSPRTTMCEGESINLTATGATTYTWIANNSGILYIGGNINPVLNSTTTFMVMGTDATSGCSSTTSFVQNVATCTGISKISGSTGINVYPNPNNGMFTVELNDNSVKTVTVMDLTGRVLLSNTTSDVTVDFNLGAYANGIYYVKVQSNDKVEVLKVVKQ